MYTILLKLQNTDIFLSSWESLPYLKVTALEREFIEEIGVWKDILEKFHKVMQIKKQYNG